ncbi:CoA transferase [Amycolatopsis endophytica]
MTVGLADPSAPIDAAKPGHRGHDRPRRGFETPLPRSPLLTRRPRGARHSRGPGLIGPGPPFRAPGALHRTRRQRHSGRWEPRDSRFATNEARVRNRHALRHALEERPARDTVDTWSARLAEAGVPADRSATSPAASLWPLPPGLEPTVAVDSCAPPQIRHPMICSATPVTRYTAPPHLGQHTDEIRRRLAEETTR